MGESEVAFLLSFEQELLKFCSEQFFYLSGMGEGLVDLDPVIGNFLVFGLQLVVVFIGTHADSVAGSDEPEGVKGRVLVLVHDVDGGLIVHLAGDEGGNAEGGRQVGSEQDLAGVSLFEEGVEDAEVMAV